MTELQYSSDASNVLNRFYGSEKVVYVEGEDDIPFWEFLFEKMTDINVTIQEVGGKPELEKYADKVFSGEIESIVAMDSDFSGFDSVIQHPNILLTCGYSIENTLISTATIWQVIRSVGKLSRKDISTDECEQWLDDLNLKSEILVIHDIKNHLDKTGLCLSLSNCSRFMEGKRTPILSKEKIENHINSFGLEVSDAESQEIKERLGEHPSGVIGYLRGHFLFSAALAFVVSMINKIRGKSSLSNEAMFGALLLSFEKTFSREHPHYSYYHAIFNGLSIT